MKKSAKISSSVLKYVKSIKKRFESIDELLDYLNGDKPWRSKKAPYSKQDFQYFINASLRLKALGIPSEMILSMLQEGVLSASHIVGLGKTKFYRKYKASLNGSTDTVFQKAKSVHQTAIARYIQNGQMTQPFTSNIKGSTSVASFELLEDGNFDGVPSYAEQFGGLNYCDVPIGRSIEDPAAYVIDLFKLMDEFIVPSNPDSGDQNLGFTARRPDIQNILLDAENTTKLVPTLEVVNKAMQTHLTTLTDSAGNVLYSDDDSLTTDTYPMKFPLNMSLQQARSSANLLDTPLSDIWTVTTNYQLTDVVNKQAIQRELVGISQSQYNLLIQNAYDNDAIVALYGRDISLADSNTVGNISATEFMSLTKLDVQGLEALLYDSLSASEKDADVQKQFFINLDASGVVDTNTSSLVYDAENDLIQNITNLRLARMNRVIRLARLLEWTYNDVDFVLQNSVSWTNSANAADSSLNLTFVSGAFPYIATFKYWMDNFGLSFNQATALIVNLKNYGEGDTGETFLTRIFGNQLEGRTWDWNDPTSQNSIQLKSSLNFSDADLWILGETLGADSNGWLWYDGSTNSVDSNGNLKLNTFTLGILYKASLLCHIFAVSLTELFYLAGNGGNPGSNDPYGSGVWQTRALFSQTQYWKVNNALASLLEIITWYKNTKLNYSRLRYLATGTSQLTDCPGLRSVPASVQELAVSSNQAALFYTQLQSDLASLTVTDTLFSVFPELNNLTQLVNYQAVLPETYNNKQNYSSTVFPIITASLMNQDMTAVGYHDTSGIVIQLPEPDQLPDVQAYVWNNLIQGTGKQPDTEALTNQLGSIVAFQKMLARYLAYFLDASGTAEFTTQLISVFDAVGVDGLLKVDDLASINLDNVNVNLELPDQNGGTKQVTSSVATDTLYQDLNLAGYIDNQGEILALPDTNLALFQTFISVQLGQNFTGIDQLISTIEATLIDDSLLALDARFFTYLIQIETATPFAEDLNAIYASMQSDQQNAFGEDLASLMGVDASLSQDLYALSMIRLGMDNPIVYFYETDPAQDSQYVLLLDAMQQSLRTNAYGGYNNNTIIFYINQQVAQTRWPVLNLQYGFLLQNLTNTYSDTKGILLQVLDTSNLADQVSELAGLTGWSVSDIDTILSYWGLDSVLQINDVQALYKFFEISQRSGLSVANMIGVTNVSAVATSSGYDATATVLTAALKATYSSTTAWERVEKPLIVATTELRRDAYADLMLYGLSLSSDSNLQKIDSLRELSEYLCTNIQMSGLTETSYVKEALSAQQFYLYRCYAGLEPSSTIVDLPEFKKLWEWMSSYTAWQANRFIFLYPENYVDPNIDLVDSAAFDTFKADLNSYLTEDVIDTALKDYMDDFTTTANLMVTGAYLDDSYEAANAGILQSVKTLYVVARTSVSPFDYYYRKARIVQDNAGSTAQVAWGGWKSIGVNLGACLYVTPAVAFGRMYIFWNEFSSGSNSTTNYMVGQGRCSYYLNNEDKWIAPQDLGAEVNVYQHFPDLSRITDSKYFKFSVSYNADNGGALYYTSIAANGLITVGNQVLSAPLALHNNSYPNAGFVPVGSSEMADFNINLFDTYKTNTGLRSGHRAIAFSEGDNQLFAPLANNMGNMAYHFSFHFFINFQPGAPVHAQIVGDNTDASKGTQILAVCTSSNFDNDNYSIQLKSANGTATELSDVMLKTGKSVWYRVAISGKAADLGSLGDTTTNIETTVWSIDNPGASNSTETLTSQTSNTIPGENFTMFNTTSEPLAYIGNQFTGSLCELLVFNQVVNHAKLQTILPLDFLPEKAPQKALLNVGDWQDYEESGDSFGDVFQANSGLVVQGADSSIVPSPGLSEGEVPIAISSPDTDFNKSLSTVPFTTTTQGTTAQNSYTMSGWLASPSPGDSPILFAFVFSPASGGTDTIGVQCTLNSSSQAMELQVFKDDTIPQTIELFSTNPNDGNYIDMATWLWYGISVNTLYDEGGYSLQVKYQVLSSGVLCNGANSQIATIVSVIEGTTSQAYSLSYDTCTKCLLTYLVPNGGTFYLSNMSAVPYAGSQYEMGNLGNSIETLFSSLNLNTSVTDVNMESSLWGQPRPKLLYNDGNEYILVPTSGENSAARYNCGQLNTPAANTLSTRFLELGAPGLFTITSQQATENNFSTLGCSSTFVPQQPSETIDFFGINGLYYWEIFLFTPWKIAKTYTNTQDYINAKKWYEYIYNPTQTEVNSDDDYWNVLALRTTYNPILAIEHELSPSQSVTDELTGVSANYTGDYAQLYNTTLALAMDAYSLDPDNANLIAALRPIAWQKGIVMDYVQVCIDFGDQLFIENTLETINEAQTQYYTAWDLLGESPDNIGVCPMPDVMTVGEILEQYSNGDDIPEFLILIEDSLVTLPTQATTNATSANNYIVNAYFGIPENGQFKALWATVEDRLYKIQNRLTIDGKPDYLPLFESPLLQGVNEISAIADGAFTQSNLFRNNIPNFRFAVMLSKAKEFVQQAASISQTLFSIQEQKDGQQLAELYVSQQQQVMDMMLTVKEDTIQAITYGIEGLEVSLESAQHREKYYSDLVAQNMNPAEITSLSLNSAAQEMFTAANISTVTGSILFYKPRFIAAEAVSLPDMGGAFTSLGNAFNSVAWQLSMASGLSASIGSHERLHKELMFQEKNTGYEIKAIKDQLKQAELNLKTAEQDLQITETQLQQLKTVWEYYQAKFTNQDLYNWMINQLNAMNYKMYQMAFSLVQNTEACYVFELGENLPNVITNNWQNKFKGLLAAQNLMVGLAQLEKSYLDNNSRRREIVKTISLKSVFPGALQQLKSTGACEIDLSMKLFSLDFPENYCVQIESLSVTLPALVAPYSNIAAELRQNTNYLLTEPDTKAAEALLNGGDISSFSTIRANYSSGQRGVALSTGINETGVLRFDESRYMPFEKTGAISKWAFAMPKEQNTEFLVLKEGEEVKNGETVPLSATELNLNDVVLQLTLSAKTGDTQFRNFVWNQIKPNGYRWNNNAVNPKDYDLV